MTIQPFHADYLPEQEGHKVWYGQFGNPKGPTILLCHGGPGDKFKIKRIKSYDLDKYHVIAFDQRGCGQSLPLGETKNNSLSNIVEDMQRLKDVLSINKWFVAGGSWGSTVALAYAEKYPESVNGLMLSSIFLARTSDENWAFSQAVGTGRLFPDLMSDRPIQNPAELLKSLKDISDPETREIIAKIMNWEGNLLTSQDNVQLISPDEVNEENLAKTKIFLSYESNNYFLKENQLIENISKLKDIPAIIVHGRYDILCPFDNAWILHQNLPNSELVTLPNSNHRYTADGEIAKNMAFKYFLEKYGN